MLVLDERLEVKSVILFRHRTAAGSFHYLPGASLDGHREPEGPRPN